MAADLFDQLLPVGTLILGYGGTRLDKGSDRRRDAIDEASLALLELERVAWRPTDVKTEDIPPWHALQDRITRLTLALRRAGAPNRLVAAVRPAVEGQWGIQRDSGDEEVGFYVDPSAPEWVRYQALKDTLTAWLGARGVARPVLRRRAMKRMKVQD